MSVLGIPRQWRAFAEVKSNGVDYVQPEHGYVIDHFIYIYRNLFTRTPQPVE